MLLVTVQVGTARSAQLVIVVTTAEVGSLRATKHYLALLDRFAPQPRLVVVNRADRGEPRKLVASALAGERITWVKEDRTLARRLVLDGEAAAQQRGRGVARTFRSFATLVADRKAP